MSLCHSLIFGCYNVDLHVNYIMLTTLMSARARNYILLIILLGFFFLGGGRWILFLALWT